MAPPCAGPCANTCPPGPLVKEDMRGDLEPVGVGVEEYWLGRLLRMPQSGFCYPIIRLCVIFGCHLT